MTTPDRITSLADNEVFVFGSNLAGRHGKGAALLALRKFGAKPGQGTGSMGQSYGIATKDERLRVLPLEKIASQIAEFLRFARERPETKFLVTQVGCGLAGYSPAEIAPLFFAHRVPENVALPASFLELAP
jgi:hypothetical protein